MKIATCPCNGTRLWGRVLSNGVLAIGVLAIGVSASVLAPRPARAEGTEECPALIPKPDMQEMVKMMSKDNLTAEDQKKLMNFGSRAIREPKTLSGCHTVTDTVDIAARVTLEPGAILKFEENAGLNIQHDGSLEAVGTKDKPITFTATDEVEGYWYGLYFASNSSHNKLVHTEILYAGGDQVGKDGTVMKRATGDKHPPTRAVFVKKDGSLDMENTHIAHTNGYGIEILGRLRGYKGNKIEKTYIPARINPETVSVIEANNSFTGNKKDQIDLISLGSVNRDAKWVDPGVPYILQYGETIAANLELSPGVTILMGNKARLSIDENGSLKAIGTADKPITIRGVSDTAGYWLGIVLQSHSGENDWQHVLVADGGGGDYFKADIYDGGHLKISNSRVENSAQYGIRVDKNSGIKGMIELADITYADNKVDYKETH